MRTLLLLIYFVFTFPILFGQRDSSYRVNVGPFKCSPDFKLRDSAQIFWANKMHHTSSLTYDFEKNEYVEKEELPTPQDIFLVRSGETNWVTFYFPNRIDSVLAIGPVQDSTGKYHVIEYYDKRHSHSRDFMNLHDSICFTQLDKFWRSTIEIWNSNNKQLSVECTVSILYSDGFSFYTRIENPTLINNKELNKQLEKSSPILAIELQDISFKADDGKEYFFLDGFAWKVINCQ